MFSQSCQAHGTIHIYGQSGYLFQQLTNIKVMNFFKIYRIQNRSAFAVHRANGSYTDSKELSAAITNGLLHCCTKLSFQFGIIFIFIQQKTVFINRVQIKVSHHNLA